MESAGLLPRSEPSGSSKPDGRGGWPAALFIIVLGFFERLGSFGVECNLIMYLTGPMGMSTAAAAAASNAYSGTVSVLPLVGALAADSRLGRYRAVLAAAVLYLLSLGMLTASSTLQAPRAHQPSCHGAGTVCSRPSTSPARLAIFYTALYLLALAQGFYRPCSEAFGADQFGQSDPNARASLSSYFNWFRLLVPLARRLTRHPAGITMLQRIGAGIAMSCAAMAVAALVEAKRLRAAMDAGLLDRPDVAVPMSLWWMVPQYVLIGLAQVLSWIGLEEFFYDQVPDALRGVGIALCLCIFGVGNYASGMLVSAIDWATRSGGESWFSDNLNRAHLDYFYWILAGLGALEVAVYLDFAKRYVYRNKA